MWCLAAEETPLWIQSHWGHTILATSTLKYTLASSYVMDQPSPNPPPHSLTQFASGHWTGMYEE